MILEHIDRETYNYLDKEQYVNIYDFEEESECFLWKFMYKTGVNIFSSPDEPEFMDTDIYTVDEDDEPVKIQFKQKIWNVIRELDVEIIYLFIDKIPTPTEHHFILKINERDKLKLLLHL